MTTVITLEDNCYDYHNSEIIGATDSEEKIQNIIQEKLKEYIIPDVKNDYNEIYHVFDKDGNIRTLIFTKRKFN